MPLFRHRPRSRRPGGRLGTAALTLLLSATALGSPAPAATAAPAAAAAAVPAAVATPFKANTEGYRCFRIPALVTTPSGALLAFAEGRVATCHDVGHNDIVMKKSTDGGRSWGPLKVVVGAGDQDAHGNPAPVVDAATGRVSLLYATGGWSGTPEEPTRLPRSLRVVHSVNDGTTWTAGAPLPHLKPAGRSWISTGPGHGIQLGRGPHRGRLVVPGDYTTTDGRAGGQLFHSDDGGLTWALGAQADVDRNTAPAYPAELTVAETTGGGVYVNARSSARCGTNDHRMAATSSDGGATFDAPFAPVSGLDTAPVSGSLLRLHAKELGAAQNRLLISLPSRLGPHTLEDRRELAIRSSYDEGRTWRTVGTVVTPGRSGYSDLTQLSTGAVGVLYETAGNIPHSDIVFTSFTEAAMDAAQRELRLPRTSDTGPGQYGNHAVVHGGAQLGTRNSGKAMAFDGQDDYLRLVSCSDSLRLGTGDFTVTAWFQHSATTGARPIIWGYGMGSGVKQFWLRAEPASGTLRAAIDTGGSFADVRTTSAYNDGQWHHAVFKRQAGRLLLSVDGGQEFSAAAPAGDITPSAQFSVHIGARPDFPNQPAGVAELFRGGLDDVRIFGRALTAQEAAQVKGGALDVANEQERVRLGFSGIW
ncbi:sialidase [Streptomyces sp. SID8374]|uniref:sialidase family protein n=1 Tax=Streptomyces sp. SID8374 TaxID=2690354 RepID=UPI001371A548|nr:sialidase family protein [Streptomyces sp. SID8374]MYX16068.1 sialidase [Streptomyces sp. SID8374]